MTSEDPPIHVELTGPVVKGHTWAWIGYDSANTVFAATVAYLLVPHMAKLPWGTTSAGIVQTVAMVLAGLATPVFASLSDRTGKAHVYCAWTTLGCIAAMAGFGAFESHRAFLLACFFLAMVCYRAALTFYNSLLPSVAEPHRMGLVSGLGVGFGYMGNVFTLALAIPVERAYGIQAAFYVTAAGFLVGAVPMMLFVRDRRVIRGKEPFSRALVRSQFRELLATVRNLPQNRPLMWFLIGNFAAADVLNTAILFFGAFVTVSFAPMAAEGELFLFGRALPDIEAFKLITGLGVTVGSFACAILLGYLADRLGAMRAYLFAAACLTVGLGSAALFAGSHPGAFLVVMCGFGGMGLAGIWTAGRKVLIELVPTHLMGRYFGLYGITLKVSVFGSTIFGFLMDLVSPAAALAGLVFPLLLTFFCLYKMVRSMRLRSATQDR